MAYSALPTEMCQPRDSKGMSARARRGGIMDSIGVDDPPRQPVAALDAVDHSPKENAEAIVELLEMRDF